MFALRNHASPQFFADISKVAIVHQSGKSYPDDWAWAFLGLSALPTLFREEHEAYEARGDCGLEETYDVVKLVVAG